MKILKSHPLLISLVLPIMLISCITDTEKYYEGELPTTPVNLEKFNTEFDDYNSTAPILGSLIPFCFSTNRKSSGGNFDIIYEPMSITFSKITGNLSVDNQYSIWGSYQSELDVIKEALVKVNTSANELGPYLIFNPNRRVNANEFLLLYASDIGGKYQIGYTHNTTSSGFTDAVILPGFNSDHNVLYPCFNSDFSKMYFCSDSENGVFNIYQAPIGNMNLGLISRLENLSNLEISKIDVLSSPYDDKCPYIFDNILVFASNRPGGEGGFDLYYSRFENGVWTAPVNFGPSINSPSDEYRPILIEEYVDVTRNMMIFSSNREGGKGGFDLYFVGV
jgi:hypothetical protein